MKQSTKLTVSALLAAALASGSLAAQQRPGATQTRRSPERSQQMRDQRTSTTQSQQTSGGALRLVPEGWVTVGTDYDNDGTLDAFETIYLYDLQQAQQASRQRSQRGVRGGQTDLGQPQEETQGQTQGAAQFARPDQQRFGQRGQQQQQQQQQQGQQQQQRGQTSLRGTIQELQSTRLAAFDQEVWVARVRTDSGRIARVLLGPANQLQQLNLRQGAQIQVRGHRGHVNDKAMLIARQIQTQQGQVQVSLPQDRQLKRIQGEIQTLRTASLPGTREQQVMARLQLPNGQTELVHLGPQSQLRQLNLQQGDQVSLLVRPVQMRGQQAIIAEQVRAHGSLVTIRQQQPARQQPRQRQPQQRLDLSQRDNGGLQRSALRQSARRPALGVTLGQQEGNQRGVPIQSVEPNSPAAESNLQPGDQLLEINGQQIQSAADVAAALQASDPYGEVDVRLDRDGLIQTANVQLRPHEQVYNQRN